VYEHILLEKTDGVATLTLNRPDVLNAYIPEMGDEVVDAFARLRDDSDVRAVVLTGAGRGFCSGVDLEYLKRVQAGEVVRKGPPLGEEDFIRKLPLDLARFPKPTIAAINGAAIGVGVTLCLPFDVRIAAQGAKLGLPFAKLGILPGLGSTHLLPRIVGLAKALELVLTARVIEAREAAEIGLVNRVVPGEALLDEAREMARMAAACSPEALERAKRALHFGATATLEEAMHNEAEESDALRRARGAGRA
jgi:2-(1,2-epoxy-1,2-dihydrophenyl)acetyl-CoA isomerase